METIFINPPPMGSIFPVAMYDFTTIAPVLPPPGVMASLPEQEMKVEVFILVLVIGNVAIAPIPLCWEIPGSIFPLSPYARSAVRLPKACVSCTMNNGSEDIFVNPEVGWVL
jgi:hypothetical protein